MISGCVDFQVQATTTPKCENLLSSSVVVVSERTCVTMRYSRLWSAARRVQASLILMHQSTAGKQKLTLSDYSRLFALKEVAD